MESIMDSIRKNPAFYIAEGLLLVLLGIISIVMPIVSTLAIEIILGGVLIISGIYRIYRSIRFIKEYKHFWLSLFSGIVALVAGILLLQNLLAGMIAIVIMLALYFLVDGIASIIQSTASRAHRYWGLLLSSGIISIVLAIVILATLPVSATWLPGLLLGINLIIGGFTLFYSAISYKTTAKAGI